MLLELKIVVGNHSMDVSKCFHCILHNTGRIFVEAEAKRQGTPCYQLQTLDTHMSLFVFIHDT